MTLGEMALGSGYVLFFEEEIIGASPQERIGEWLHRQRDLVGRRLFNGVGSLVYIFTFI